MLHVAELQGLFFLLGGKEPVLKIPLGPRQGPHQGRGGGPVCLKFRRAAHEHVLLQARQRFFQQLPPGLYRLHVAALVPAHRPQPLVAKRAERRQDFVPGRGGDLAQQVLRRRQVRPQGGQVGGKPPVRLGLPQVLLGQGQGALGPPPPLGPQRLAPGGIVQRPGLLPRRTKILQRAGWVGHAAQKVVQCLQHPCRLPVASALAVQVGKGAEVRVGVSGFQRVRQALRPQGGQLRPVRGGKVRRDVQPAEMGLHQLQTVSVDGADGRALQKHALAAQVRAARLFGQLARQPLRQLAPQAGRRRPRKGHDQQLVGGHRVLFPAQKPHRPLHQHGGLAAARGGAHQQRPLPVLYGPCLFRRKLHGSPPPFPFLFYPRHKRGGQSSWRRHTLR